MKKDLLQGFALSFLLLSFSALAYAGEIKGKVEVHGIRSAQDIAVYVDAIAGKTFTPPANAPVEDQKHMTFVPHVLVVLKGTTVQFLNSDPVGHNVYPEDAGGIFVDLAEELLDRSGIDEVVRVPEAMAVRPKQGPPGGCGVVAELPNGKSRPLRPLLIPRRTTFEDGDRFAAHPDLDPHFAAELLRCLLLAVLPDLEQIKVRYGAHRATVDCSAGW